ncbi:MAG: YeeE/YedE family protein, partial [Actinomycetota bacterium]|nr:YeeE/YedE family protein [Actinomycetota bacterium]
RLLVGGFLLGAGGWIAGGCNLGHGLSGMAQLNVSSIVVVICMALGVGHARAMTRPVSRTRTSAC